MKLKLLKVHETSLKLTEKLQHHSRRYANYALKKQLSKTYVLIASNIALVIVYWTFWTTVTLSSRLILIPFGRCPPLPSYSKQ